MVIFGAGASYDSFAKAPPGTVLFGDSPYQRPVVGRPPLARELFDVRFADDYRLFKKCQPLIQRLQRPEDSVENVLERFQSEERRPARRVQLVAVRYYLNRMLARCQSVWTDQVTQGVTNYQTMLDQIETHRVENEKICLVTFNYDTLLERAIIDSIGAPLNTINDYIASDYKVIKPHGSINWAHPIRDFRSHRGNSQDLISDILANVPPLDVDAGSYETVTEDPFQRDPTRPLFPALALPVEHKQRYECPQEHFKVLEQCLREVTKISIVGWRAIESNFLDTLVKGISKRVRVKVVSGTDEGANEVVARLSDKWRVVGKGANISAVKPPGFSNFIFSSEWEDFVKSEPR